MTVAHSTKCVENLGVTAGVTQVFNARCMHRIDGLRNLRRGLRFVRWRRVLPNSLSYLRFLAKVIKAIPMIKSGIETQSVPKSATLFRFRTANTAAATRKRIPIKRRVLDDKIRPPSGSLI